MKTLKIAQVETHPDYAAGIVPLLIKQLGYRIEWTGIGSCDLLVYGAYFEKKFQWLPGRLRPASQRLVERRFRTLGTAPLTLFHTSENLRHDFIDADFSISYDLGVHRDTHVRIPYWMELVDWSHEGLSAESRQGWGELARYGKLLSLDRLLEPLGRAFLNRPRKAALFSSHLREPRRTLYELVGKCVETRGFGRAFDRSIRNHNFSNFTTHALLQDYAFSLCPENSPYPGFYTEKVPEAHVAGCMAISWADSNISTDFNPAAFINLFPMQGRGFSGLREMLCSDSYLKRFCDEPLLLARPTLEPVREFVREMVRQATS